MSLSKLRALDDFAEDRRNHPGPAAEPIPAPIAPGKSVPDRFGEPPGVPHQVRGRGVIHPLRGWPVPR